MRGKKQGNNRKLSNEIKVSDHIIKEDRSKSTKRNGTRSQSWITGVVIRNDEVGDHGQGPDEQPRVEGRQGNLGPQRIHSKG